jgi:hypothetical protein
MLKAGKIKGGERMCCWFSSAFAIPVFALALIAFMRSQYGDEVFGLAGRHTNESR